MYICKLYHAKNAGILPKFGCFAKKNERSTSVGKGMKDQTVFFFMCGGSGWDGQNYEARKGILVHTCCSNKRRIYSDKWRKDFRVPSRTVSFCEDVFCLVYLRFLSQGSNKNWKHRRQRDGRGTFCYAQTFGRFTAMCFFPWIFFWLEKYRTLKYSQPSPKYTAVKIDPIQHPPKLAASVKRDHVKRRLHCPTINFLGM